MNAKPTDTSRSGIPELLANLRKPSGESRWVGIKRKADAGGVLFFCRSCERISDTADLDCPDPTCAAPPEPRRLTESEMKLVIMFVSHSASMGLPVTLDAQESAWIRSIINALDESLNDIVWMSGSSDFAPEGQAHQGWVKARERLAANMSLLPKRPVPPDVEA